MDENIQNQEHDELILGKFKDVDALAEAYKNLERNMGSRVKIPDFVNGSEEDVNKFYSKVRPADKDAYELGDVDGAEELRELAYKNGLNPMQAKAIGGFLSGKRMVDSKFYTVENSTEMAKEIFGDRAPEVSNKAGRVLQNVLSEEELSEIEKLDNRATMALYKAIDKLYQVGEEGKLEAPGGMMPGGMPKGKPDYKGFNEEYAKMKSRPHSVSEIEALKVKYNVA